MFIIYIVLYSMFFLFLLIALIIFIPFEYYASGEKYDDTKLAVELSWLLKAISAGFILRTGSGIKYNIRLFGFKINIGNTGNMLISKNSRKTYSGKCTSKKAGSKKRKRSIDMTDKDFIIKTISFISSVFNRIKPYHFEIDGKYGFDEPYNTAALCSLAAVFCGREKSDRINVHPVFDEEILEGRFLVRGRIIPGLVVLQAAGYILSKPVRKIIFN